MAAVSSALRVVAPTLPASTDLSILERIERVFGSWRISDELPRAWSIETWRRVQADGQAALDSAMAPAGMPFVSQQLERFFAVLPLPGNGDKAVQRQALAVWIEKLSAFPAAPLVRALDKVIMTHVWATPPQIAEVVQAVESDPVVVRWRSVAGRLKSLGMKLDWMEREHQLYEARPLARD